MTTQDQIFTEGFGPVVYDKQEIAVQYKGLTVVARLDVDNLEPPWRRVDGHGPVINVAKRPTQQGLRSFGNGWLYDFNAAVEMALAENWGPAETYKFFLVTKEAYGARLGPFVVPEGTPEVPRIDGRDPF